MDRTTRDPPRRRVAQACSTCRGRKIRCDAGVPKCSLCVDLNVDCVYLDSQYSKIDAGTRVVLERIQRLEDRLFSSSPFSVADTSVEPGLPHPAQPNSFEHGHNDTQLTLPVSHEANADHVYRWPIVQEILDRGLPETENAERLSTFPKLYDVTDIFLVEPSRHSSDIGIESWHLFDDESLQYFRRQPRIGSNDFWDILPEYENLISAFFANIHAFYPIIRQEQVYKTLHTVFSSEVDQHGLQDDERQSQYCVLLMVLCLGALAASGNVLLPKMPLQPDNSPQVLWERRQDNPANDNQVGIEFSNSLEDRLWKKAQLLLGSVSLDDSLEAGQCFTLASVYLGAKGRPVDSDHNIHVAARKCKLIARRETLIHKEYPEFSDPFRRLFWVVYVNESDFASEFSLTPPSGMTLFEDIVPYPSPDDTDSEMDYDIGLNKTLMSTSLPDPGPYDNFAAFQVSTSSAIRRFINRATAVLYSPHEVRRKENHTTYIMRLHRLASELRSHHEAIHKNLPSFLLSTDPSDFWPQINPGKSTSTDTLDQLQADQRPQIRTFTMVIILMVATTAPAFRLLLPPDIESVIAMGRQNMRRFSACVKEFEWHNVELEKVDRGRHKINRTATDALARSRHHGRALGTYNFIGLDMGPG
ncbi:hypothetical protein V499_08578 [Pseudogymnoascus sp. VKM F-103]|nr:hypothetical protein V499_08578 [Pseudogymnoascus sp. VKM F-103]